MPAKIMFGNINSLSPDELRKALQDAGITRIDTAARYQNGESEKIIGRSGLSQAFDIDTKILFTSPDDACLRPEAINKSLLDSLDALGLDRVNVLYCHAPDYRTPVFETAQAFNEHYQAGRCKYAGVSNFSPEVLSEWLEIADEHGWVKPTWYEGQYNLLCHGYEEDLFPLLRKHGIAFAACSPLAGGFFVGRFTDDGELAETRFAIQTPYTGWYDQPGMHEAIRKLRALSEKTGLGMDELSLRWLTYHLALKDEDVMILGASRISQISQSVGKANGGPLSEAVVEALNGLWEGVKEHGMTITDDGPTS